MKNIEGCHLGSQGEALEEFLLNLSLSHDIVTEISEDNEIIYQLANPDEVILVSSSSE